MTNLSIDAFVFSRKENVMMLPTLYNFDLGQVNN